MTEARPENPLYDTLAAELKQHPDSARAHNDMGVVWYEQGNKETALEHYERAVSLDPGNTVFRKNLADLLWNEMGDAQRALEMFVEVLKSDPRDAEALLSCAQICMTSDRPQDGRDFVELALTIEPWNQDARKMLNQLDAGPRDIDPAPSADELYLGAQGKAGRGDLRGAIDDLNRLLQRSPNHALAHNDLGVLYYDMGDLEKARSHYEKAYQLAPEQPNIAKNLADFYLLELQRTEEAMKLYVQVLEKLPQDVDSLMATAFVCTTLGQTQEAAVFYRRVIDIEPWNQSARGALDKLESDRKNGNSTATHRQAAG